VEHAHGPAIVPWIESALSLHNAQYNQVVTEEEQGAKAASGSDDSSPSDALWLALWRRLPASARASLKLALVDVVLEDAAHERIAAGTLVFLNGLDRK